VKRQTIKHHLQTLCAMNHMDYKLRETHAYAQLFIVISQLSLGDDAIDQVFRRMAFNVMARNCDDHTKNFSFILKHNGKWQLSPAYDVTHAHDPNNIWLAQHLMSVNGKFDDITREDLLAEADRFGVRRPNDLLADVRGALDNWTAHADSAGMTTAAAEEVAADFQLL
jgi:serine/threonine-protein kinase HipA